MASGKRHQSEVEAYAFIRARLEDAGWVCKQPDAGQVWSQNNLANDPALKLALGKLKPENIVKISETAVWVIEAKAKTKQLTQAIEEARDFYAAPISEHSGRYSALIATGVAGNEDDGYEVTTEFCVNGQWRTVTINEQVATGFLTPQDVSILLDTNSHAIADFRPNQAAFFKAAEAINRTLHAGGVDHTERATVMAALLLSMLTGPLPLDTSLQVLIRDINNRSEEALTKHDKGIFAPFVAIKTPTSRKNHVKYRKALIDVILRLRDLNIKSAMNSDTDVLGQFYEAFLKYGNGAKEIGIVLTPRHITRFAAEAVQVGPDDIVLDPACGTGGFLVAAFDRVRRTAPSQLDRFKKHAIFGVEEKPSIAVLAIINMIFRGDGKHHIEEGNAFVTYLEAKTQRGHPTAKVVDKPVSPDRLAVTKILMNPPFALPGAKEQEFHFIKSALGQLRVNGLLFALLPMDSMGGDGDSKFWRQTSLLAENRLLVVITLPADLFSPVAQKQVVAVIIRRGTPHPQNGPVLWARAVRDGFAVVKSKRLEGSQMVPPRLVPNDLPEVLQHIKRFIADPDAYAVSVPMLASTKPIDFSDPLLELIPEAYLDGPTLSLASLQADASRLVRETASFIIRYERDELFNA